MHIFVTGTDTDIGKTLVASWICLHTGYDYFKPIQTGGDLYSDCSTVAKLTNSTIHKPLYSYQSPVSPHLAARLENDEIDINNINLPNVANLVIEGAGGVMVPINQNHLMIDLIKKLGAPVVLVASSRLGTINHTLMSLNMLRQRQIKILGVVVSGELNQDNCDAIKHYGGINILAQIPKLTAIDKATLKQVSFANFKPFIW